MTTTDQSTDLRRRFRAVIDALPDSLVGQVIGGKLIVLPRPATPHARAASSLNIQIGGPFDGDDAPDGWWVLPEPELSLETDPDFDPVVPDLAGWRRSTMPRLPEVTQVTVAPDWVCEVLSPSTEVHDRSEKMPFYARAGVSHGWLVDPEERTLEAFARDGEVFRPIGRWRDEARVGIAPFEAIELNLARLWVR